MALRYGEKKLTEAEHTLMPKNRDYPREKGGEVALSSQSSTKEKSSQGGMLLAMVNDGKSLPTAATKKNTFEPATPQTKNRKGKSTTTTELGASYIVQRKRLSVLVSRGEEKPRSKGRKCRQAFLAQGGKESGLHHQGEGGGVTSSGGKGGLRLQGRIGRQ